MLQSIGYQYLFTTKTIVSGWMRSAHDWDGLRSLGDENYLMCNAVRCTVRMNCFFFLVLNVFTTGQWPPFLLAISHGFEQKHNNKAKFI